MSPSLSLCFPGPVLLLFSSLLTKVFNCSPSLQPALPGGDGGGERNPEEGLGGDWEKGFNFCVCFISPSHYNLIFFKQNTSAELKVGGSEQTTKHIWIYIFPPSLSFTVGHFLFLFFSFCLVLFCFVFFCIN